MIVPPEMVHEYVEPASIGTEAVLPVEFAQTADAAVIVTFGSAVIVMTWELARLHPFASVTVTLRVSEAPAPAV